MKLSNLEKKLFGAAHPDLAWGALVASGVRDQRELDDYLARINMLCQHIETTSPAEDDLQKAKALFDWLWKTKPDRHEYQGDFRLTEVVDAQLDPNAEKVGNCLGLTVLYNVLAQRLGLAATAVHLEEAFGRGPHVLSTLESNYVTIDIENIFPHGFDFKGHLGNPQRIGWGDAGLIGDIYHSTGNQLFERGELEEAVRSYGKAIWLNPEYTKAHLNRGIALAMLGQDKEAEQNFERQG